MKIAIIPALVISTLSFSGQAEAVTPRGESWMDSFSRDGKCWIDSTFDHGAGDIKVNTPEGRMTVREAYNWQKKNGRPNRRSSDPIYNDVQCGNGPGNGYWDEDQDVCPGRVDKGEKGCQERGPKWWWGGNTESSSDAPVTSPVETTPVAPAPEPEPKPEPVEACSVIGLTDSSARNLFNKHCGGSVERDCDTINTGYVRCSNIPFNGWSYDQVGDDSLAIIEEEPAYVPPVVEVEEPEIIVTPDPEPTPEPVDEIEHNEFTNPFEVIGEDDEDEVTVIRYEGTGGGSAGFLMVGLMALVSFTRRIK